MKRFAMEELGKIENYIGLNIDYDYERMSKTKNIESLAVKYNLENTKLLDTSMETNQKLEQAREIDLSLEFRNLIGELAQGPDQTQQIL